MTHLSTFLFSHTNKGHGFKMNDNAIFKKGELEVAFTGISLTMHLRTS